MKTRKITLFKVNGEVVIEENNDLTISDIEKMKWIIVSEIDCSYDEIDIECLDMQLELSQIDVTTDGLLDWKDAYFTPIIGVKLNIEIGSDLYLDAMLTN